MAIQALADIVDLSSKSAFNENRIAVSVSYTIVDEDFVRTFGTGTMTITLPNATTNNRRRTIKHIGTVDLTIDCVGGQTIDGVATLTLRGGKKNAVTLESQGGQWWIV